jgi:LAO/AO transport system kinase
MYDIILVETVGVGQSEMNVRNMVDVYLLMLIAGAGDSLQGIKRGVLEVADGLLINKADGDGVVPAERAAREYAMALQMMRGPDDAPPVLTCSGLKGTGVEDAWDFVSARVEGMRASGRLRERRATQRVAWMWRELDAGFRAALRNRPGLAAESAEIEARVRSGHLAPAAAAEKVLRQLLGPKL